MSDQQLQEDIEKIIEDSIGRGKGNMTLRVNDRSVATLVVGAPSAVHTVTKNRKEGYIVSIGLSTEALLQLRGLVDEALREKHPGSNPDRN